MINCHDSRGKGILFFLLVIYSGCSYSCNFNHNPISDDYMKKINTMAGYIPTNCQVERPVIIPEEEDQNCILLLRLFLINSTLANIGRHGGSELDKLIIGLQNEIYFLEECSFTIPSACPTERVTIFTVLQNLNASLAALKPHIENNFSHCLRVKCAAGAEHISTMRNTIATRRHNKGHHEDSNVDVISEEPTTPTVKLNDGSSDQISGDPLQQSKGARNHIATYCILGIILLLILPIMVVI